MELERKKVNLVGIVKFVGELFRVSMLTAGIVDECLSKLVVDSSDVLLEAGCRLLEGVGLKFKNEARIKIEKGGGIINADDVKWITNCLQSTTNGCYCAAALIVEM